MGHDLKVFATNIADEEIAWRAVTCEDDAEKTRLRVEAPKSVVFPDPRPAGQ